MNYLQLFYVYVGNTASNASMLLKTEWWKKTTIQCGNQAVFNLTLLIFKVMAQSNQTPNEESFATSTTVQSSVTF